METFVAIFIILYLLLFFFSFSFGCDRYVENDDVFCKRTFLDHMLPTLWKMLPIFTVSSGCECYRKRIIMPQTRLFYPTHNIAKGQNFPANSKSVHGLHVNRWDIKPLFVMTIIIVSYRRCVRSCRHSAQRKGETELCRSSP